SRGDPRQQVDHANIEIAYGDGLPPVEKIHTSHPRARSLPLGDVFLAQIGNRPFGREKTRGALSQYRVERERRERLEIDTERVLPRPVPEQAVSIPMGNRGTAGDLSQEEAAQDVADIGPEAVSPGLDKEELLACRYLGTRRPGLRVPDLLEIVLCG